MNINALVFCNFVLVTIRHVVTLVDYNRDYVFFTVRKLQTGYLMEKLAVARVTGCPLAVDVEAERLSKHARCLQRKLHAVSSNTRNKNMDME